MTDILATGSAWLHQQRHAYATTSVTIARGSQTCTANATPGNSSRLVLDANGVYVTVQTQDFTFRAEDYAPTGSASEPEPGDVITYLGLSFAVLPEDDDMPHFSFCDQERENFTAYTKER